MLFDYHRCLERLGLKQDKQGQLVLPLLMHSFAFTIDCWCKKNKSEHVYVFLLVFYANSYSDFV